MKRGALNDFLNDYRDRCEERGQRPMSKAKLRAILEDFILAETWQDEDPTLLDLAFTSLRRIVAKDKGASQILDVIERETVELNRRLERQRYNNTILYEQFVILADQLAQRGG
ncbi:MAG: hypothetical protein AB7V46_13125 [Thermomicrobiales bacterium]